MGRSSHVEWTGGSCASVVSAESRWMAALGPDIAAALKAAPR